MYRLYGDSKRRGWELIILAIDEKYLNSVIENIDREVYRGYMVIESNELGEFPIKRERFDEVKKKVLK